MSLMAVLLGAAMAITVWRVNSDRRAQPRSALAEAGGPQTGISDGVLRLPPPNLIRSLSPEDAQAANDTRPVIARSDAAPVGFTITGDQVSRMRAIDCLTQAIYYEAASEGVDGGRAVAQIVLNRMRHPGYPNSICGVIYEGSTRASGCQFSFTCDGSLARAPLKYLWTRSRDIATLSLAGGVFAPVGHATHYHADYVLPYWADSLDKVAVIGRHIFYRLKGSMGSVGAFRQRYASIEPFPAPQPPTTVIEEALQTLTAGAAVLPGSDLPKVEEDRVAALTPGTMAAADANAQLQADMSRGTLIVGEQAAPAKKETNRPLSQCDNKGVQQVTAIGANDVRTGIAKPNC